MKVSVTVFAQGWFGGKKMKAAIGFDKVVEILHKFQAPADVSTCEALPRLAPEQGATRWTCLRQGAYILTWPQP